MLFSTNEEAIILDYLIENGWIKKSPYFTNYIMDLNRIYIDLIYGKDNRFFNEFIYQYLTLEQDEIVPTLKYLISQIQVIQTNVNRFNINPCSKKKPPQKTPYVLNEEIEDDVHLRDALQKRFDAIYKKYDYAMDERNQKAINHFLYMFQQFKQGKIEKSELIKELTLKNGIYYRRDIPVLQQCQVEEDKCQMENLQEQDLLIETQVYVSKILYEYFKILQMSMEQQIGFIRAIQFLSDEQIKQFIVSQNYGGMDYIIRLTILALYKNKSQDFDFTFDYELYIQMIQLSDKETLRFRQETASDVNIDFDAIVDGWWEEIGKNYKELSVNEDSDLELSDFLANQNKQMGPGDGWVKDD